MIKGISISEGISIAKIYMINELNLNIKRKEINSIEDEIIKFKQAIEHTIDEITKIKEIALNKFGDEKAQIFESHLLVIKDPALTSEVEEKIKNDKVNCEYALLIVRNKLIDVFSAMKDNVYMKERAYDIKDATNRIIAFLTNQKFDDLFNIKEEVVLVGKDLSASEVTLLNPRYIKGIVVANGGQTSHASIITRSLEIPCIVSKKILKNCKENDKVIVDATKGVYIINPDNIQIDEYLTKINEILNQKEINKLFKDKDTVTKDGYKTKIYANIASIEELENVANSGAEGIGLFRTEFLYMQNNHLPSEDEQYEIYKKILEFMGDKEVVIRTLDIGGDKKISYLPFKKELNPFLGNRAVRFCLKNKEIFRTQLRALLKASKYGNLKIMFPMISLVEELIECKKVLEEVNEELLKENVVIGDYKIGITIEVPSAVLLMDKLVKYVDFFSIGTNDLIQYTFAADRLNESVNYLYQPLNPSILRMIKHTIDVAHKNNKEVGMCGEASSNVNLIPILIAYGLDEFSMNPSSVLNSRYIISKLNKEKLSNEVNNIDNCDTESDVIEFVKQININI